MIQLSEEGMSKEDWPKSSFLHQTLSQVVNEKKNFLKEIKSATLYCCYGESCSGTTKPATTFP